MKYCINQLSATATNFLVSGFLWSKRGEFSTHLWSFKVHDWAAPLVWPLMGAVEAGTSYQEHFRSSHVSNWERERREDPCGPHHLPTSFCWITGGSALRLQLWNVHSASFWTKASITTDTPLNGVPPTAGAIQSLKSVNVFGPFYCKNVESIKDYSEQCAWQPPTY